MIGIINAEGYQEEKFEKVNKKLTDTNLFANRVMALLMPTMTFVTSRVTIAIYWIGVYLIDAAGQMTRLTLFSYMVVFSSYAMQVIMAFTLLTMMFIMLPRVLVSAKRIIEVIDTKMTMENGNVLGDVSIDDHNVFAPIIEFQDVCFRYPDTKEDVLHNINLKVDKGETVAIIGATASGKSSLINLITRLYDVQRGTVLVNGIDVKAYDIHVLRDKIGFTTQKAILFGGRVTSNVAYGSTDKQTKVLESLNIAQAMEFVSKMPEGVDADIAQGGANVSGGQKQRLSIARAICKDPDIYIFDDSFSALDYKTDHQLRRELSKMTKGTTKIIVAQRISTIMDADRIIVLEDGEIVGQGKHKALLGSCEVYREIASSQLEKEEL